MCRLETEDTRQEDMVHIEGELKGEQGFVFSRLMIDAKKETLMEFYKYIVSRDIKNIKFLPRALYSGAMYGVGIYDEKRVKESFLKFIENIEEKELAILTKEFYHDRLSKILYKDAVDMIKKLKNEGYMVILISASPEFYIKEFYAIDEVDLIIGTRFKFENGKFIRSMDGNIKIRGIRSY